jgi:hypothetical protein
MLIDGASGGASTMADGSYAAKGECDWPCATPWRGKECWGPILLRNARQTGIKAVTVICSRATRECCAFPEKSTHLRS